MKLKSSFMLQVVGGEKLLVPFGAEVRNLSGLVTLNDTAAFLLDLLAEERSLDDLAVAVAKRFNVSLEIARKDIRIFVAEMAELGILKQ